MLTYLIGGRVETLDRTWRVSGLTTGMTNIVNSVSYVRFQDFAAARGLRGVASYVHAATLAQLREIGVMKALGAGPGRLGAIVLSQAAWIVGTAMGLAVLLAVGLGWTLARISATLPLRVEPSSVARVAVGSALLGVLGAVSPLIKVSRVDLATVFRRQA